MTLKRILTLIIILAVGIGVSAAPIDDARRLYSEGDYEGALTKLTALHKKKPRDGTINYWLAATLTALDRTDEAIEYYEAAETAGVSDAALFLAEHCTNAYLFEDAIAHYDSYESILRKNRKTVPEDVERQRSSIVLMANMIQRVERIAVVDSIVVDTEEFFRHYRLSPEAGRLVNGATARLADVEVAYIPQNNTEIIYSVPDTTGCYVLMSADVLDDGTVDHPQPLEGDNLAGGGNAEYPFLLSDGLTLYYAHDGEGSIGGYDIFMTRRDEDGFLQPQNVGMPYNSPDDDYMLAIDETTGVGWWATDRNHIPGKVTIYVFVVNDSRVNVPADDPQLVQLARIDDISLTQSDVDVQAVRARINEVGTAETPGTPTGSTFAIPIGSASVVYHNLSDFKSDKARRLMFKAVDTRAGIQRIEEQLNTLRAAYRAGDTSGAIRILDLEQQLESARTTYRDLVNQAIEAELNR